MRKRPLEVFLSHSDRDRRFVGRLAEVLDLHGIQNWYSRRRLRGAQQWHDEIGTALSRCNWFVVVLTPAAVRSRWVKRELIFALSSKRYENRIVPLLLRKCASERLSWTLAGFQRIDFRGGVDQGMAELLRTWSIAYRPGTGRRSKPKRRGRSK